MSKFKDPFIWLRGLLAAFITGGANVTAAVVIAPETFNLSAGIHHLWQMAVASGIIGVAAYLKQSPLPEVEENEATK